MFERILFPTDFSVYANAVTACLPSFLSAGVKEVILLHVLRSKDDSSAKKNHRESDQYTRWNAEEQLNLIRMVMESHGLSARTRIEYGSPMAEIIRVAHDERASMIVVGSQMTTLAQEMMVGSTAFQIIRRSHIPVLLLKAEGVREEGHLRCRWTCAEIFKRVLHPTDFSTFSDGAYTIVESLRGAGMQEAVLLHVQDERVMKNKAREQRMSIDQEDRQRLEQRCQQLTDLRFKARWLLRYGNPAQETLQVADEVKPGVIVVGSQGCSPMQELRTGSTLESVVRLAKQPVLIIRTSKSMMQAREKEERKQPEMK